MLRLYSKITFTAKTSRVEKVFDFVNDVEIQSSYEDLTSTAKITIPRNVRFNGQPIAVGVSSIFKRGDEVKIELGYYPNLRTVFEGYIARVGNVTPIEIDCEDKMFLLKQNIVTYPTKYRVITTSKKGKALKKPKIQSANVTLQELLDNILPEDLQYNLLIKGDVNLGSFRINKASTAMALDVLKSDYGIYSYFVDGVLNIGQAANASDTKTKEFKFEETIIDEESLEYKREDDIILKINAVSIKADNSKIELSVGDEDGDQKTFHAYNMNEASLREFAETKLKEFKYEGYRGRLETFGEPYVRSGDNAKLTSLKYPEKNGTYQIKSVNRKFGMNGYRQNLELGIKVA